MKRREILIAVVLIASMASAAHAQWHWSDYNCGNLDPSTTGNHAWWCGQMYPPCDATDPEGGYGNDWDADLHFYAKVANPMISAEIRVTAQLNIDTDNTDFLYLECETVTGYEAFAVFSGQGQGIPVDETFTYAPGDYVGAGADLVHLRWRFVSDEAGSDEDCGEPSAGGAQIDLIQVTSTNKIDKGLFSAIETCEPGDPFNWGVTSTTFQGFEIVAEGEALLAPNTHTVTNMGSSGTDGFFVILNPTAEPQYNNLWAIAIAYPDTNDGLPVGAGLEFASHKAAGGGGTEEIGTMRMEKTGTDAWSLEILHFPFTEYSLEGFANGVQVFAVDVTDGSLFEDSFPVGDVVVTAGTAPEVGFHGYYPIEWTWEDDVQFSPTSGGTYVVDSVRLYHQEAGLCPPLEHVYLRGVDVPQFTLTGLDARYDVGTTHNAGLAYFHANNPDWPPEGILTEADVEYVADSVTHFMIAEAGFDSMYCQVFADSMMQVNRDMGMFHDVEGTIYYGAPVVSDSFMTWRTDFLVDNGYLSRAVADVQVNIYSMLAAVRNSDDFDLVQSYVSDLNEMEWSDEDAEAIAMMVDVHNSSTSYWNGFFDEPQGPWDFPEPRDWLMYVSVDDAVYAYNHRHPIPLDAPRIMPMCIVSIYESTIAEARKYLSEKTVVDWFGWNAVWRYDHPGNIDIFRRYLIIVPLNTYDVYGSLLPDIGALQISPLIWVGDINGDGSKGDGLKVETYANDGSGLPLLVTSLTAEENDWDLASIAAHCGADSVTMDCWLGGASMLHRDGLSPLEGGFELLTIKEPYSGSIELNQRVLPTGEMTLSVVLPGPRLVSIPDGGPEHLLIDGFTMYTHGLNTTATEISQVGFLATAGVSEFRVTGFSASQENIIRVPGGHSTIQAAIDAAADGDVVLVEPGTYPENINFNGKLITVASRYWDTGDLSYLGTTVIDGTANGTVATFVSGEDATSVLSGFTLTNGQANYGGGVRCTDSSPYIHHCVIEGNATTYDGAGIYLLRSSPRLEDLEVHDNTAGRHGGAVCSGLQSNPTIRRCSLRRNHAANGGGLWCFSDANPVVENTEIVWNTANHGGGMFCFDACAPHLSGVTIARNTAAVQGGGILCYGDSGPTMINSILWDNSPQEATFDSGLNNSLSVAYCDVKGGLAGIVTGGHGTVDWLDANVNLDPLFADPSNDDFTLASGSPCIDVGAAYFEHASEVWVSLIPGNFLGMAPDLGFFETDGPLAISGQPDEVPTPFWVGRNYPNPFNPTTTIEYSLPSAGPVSLNIYDIAGRLVCRLIDNEVQTLGHHSATWNGRTDRGSTVASGVYVYSVESGGRFMARKMVLLK